MFGLPTCTASPGHGDDERSAGFGGGLLRLGAPFWKPHCLISDHFQFPQLPLFFSSHPVYSESLLYSLLIHDAR
jgi:hypothetical protein